MPTTAQTRAKRTAWSLKKSIGGPPSTEFGAEGARRGLFLSHESDTGPAERCRAEVLLRLWRDLRHDCEQQLAQSLVVRLKDLDDRLVRNRTGVRPMHTDVVIGDHRDVRVAELELPREIALGVRGHVDHVPTCILEPLRLGAGREARPLDRHDGAAVANRDTELARGLDEQPAEVGAIRVGRRDVSRLGAVVKRVRPSGRAVDELVADDELAQPQLRLQRPRRVRADDPPHAELLHRPDVRAVRDLVRRQLVLWPVARQERDPLAADLADHERPGRLPVRGVELDLLDVLEERVEAGAPEDPDLGRHAARETNGRRSAAPWRGSPGAYRDAATGR